MAADPKIVALQGVLNRFPSTNPTLVTDGLLGDKTAAALIKALTWIAANVSGASESAQGLASRLTTAEGGYNFLQIRQSAEGLTTYLNDRADEKKLTLIQTSFTPTVKTAPTQEPAAVLAYNQQSKVVAAAKQATQHVPAWAMYASGAALIVAAIGATAYSIKRSGGRASAPAVAGWGANLLRGSSETNREGLTWEEWRDAAKYADRSGMHPEKVKAWRQAWKRGVDPTEMGQS
jgi:hypothetical protein